MSENRLTGGMHRITSLGVGLALIVAACGGAQASPTSAPATPALTGGPTAAPTAAADPYADVCAAGAAEGSLIHWHNYGDEMETVYEAFRAAHPGIATEFLILPNDENAQRVLTEASAGRQITPDISSTSLDIFIALIERGIVATDIDWAGLGVSADVLHSRNLVRNFRVPFGLTYSTERLTAADLPDTWEDLIDAKWRGRIVVDARGRPFDIMGLVWGRDQTIDYVQRLRDTVAPLVIRGATNGIVAVLGGEADFSTGGRSAETLEQQAVGAPLDIKYLELLATNEGYNYVFKDARHPNAARCFVAWLARDGTEVYNKALFRTNDAIPPQAPAGAKVVSIESAQDAEFVQSLASELGKIWAGG